jgi:hypothetical protein
VFQGGEIDMGGEVGLAGRGERVGESVTRNRLQRIADSAPVMAVIGDQRGERRVPGPLGQGGEKMCRRRPRLDDGAFSCIEAPNGSRNGAARQRFPGAERKAALCADGDGTLMPCAAYAHQLPDRQRVDEFIGDDDRRALRQVLDPLEPTERNRGGAQCLALRFAQHRARLDQRDVGAGSEPGHGLEHAQRVGHERAAPGAKFGDGHA